MRQQPRWLSMEQIEITKDVELVQAMMPHNPDERELQLSYELLWAAMNLQTFMRTEFDQPELVLNPLDVTTEKIGHPAWDPIERYLFRFKPCGSRIWFTGSDKEPTDISPTIPVPPVLEIIEPAIPGAGYPSGPELGTLPIRSLLCEAVGYSTTIRTWIYDRETSQALARKREHR